MIRKAKIGDVVPIQKMLVDFAQDGKLLPRSLSELYTNLRDMFIAFDEENATVPQAVMLSLERRSNGS